MNLCIATETQACPRKQTVPILYRKKSIAKLARSALLLSGVRHPLWSVLAPSRSLGGGLPPKARAVGADPAHSLSCWGHSPRGAQHTGTRPGDTGTAQLLPRRCLPSLCAKRQRFHPFPWDNIGQPDMILCQEVFPDIQSEFSHFTSVPLSSVYIVKS